MLTVETDSLTKIAQQIRARVIEYSHKAQTPHLGSSLSCIDILVALYSRALRIDPKRASDMNRDRFILSKGHAALALYVTLEQFGFISRAELDSYATPGSLLGEQPIPYGVPGIEAATGSLGHGLPIGLGIALGAKQQGRDSRVFVLMSDGECNEGSVWEGALFAPAHGLNNIVGIVDYNKWQATGRSNETMSLAPLRDKWQAFGWDSFEVDGNDMQAVCALIDKVNSSRARPTMIVAHTVKGKGVSFMEDDNNWHYRIPTAEEVQQARVELGVS